MFGKRFLRNTCNAHDSCWKQLAQLINHNAIKYTHRLAALNLNNLYDLCLIYTTIISSALFAGINRLKTRISLLPSFNFDFLLSDSFNNSSLSKLAITNESMSGQCAVSFGSSKTHLLFRGICDLLLRLTIGDNNWHSRALENNYNQVCCLALLFFFLFH